MTTMEKLGWLAIILALLIAVGATIMVPIFNKAVEQKDEINNFELEISSGLLNNKHEIAIVDYYGSNEKPLADYTAYIA